MSGYVCLKGDRFVKVYKRKISNLTSNQNVFIARTVRVRFKSAEMKLRLTVTSEPDALLCGQVLMADGTVGVVVGILQPVKVTLYHTLKQKAITIHFKNN